MKDAAQGGSHDPRDIPVLTEAVEHGGIPPVSIHAKDASSAIITATLKLADSLLHQAAKDIEATLFEQVFDRLRAELPELVDRVLAERAIPPIEGVRPSEPHLPSKS